MSKTIEKRCMGCMNPKMGDGLCPSCGFDPKTPTDPNYIPPGTQLDDQYLVGERQHFNGEGATYIGFDQREKKPVWIREYFPFTIAHRDPETGDIQPNTGRGAQFKALRSDFVELCNEARRLSVSDPVVPVENMLGANGTIYVIYKHLETLPLEEYLLSQGGRLSVAEGRKLLIPLFNGVDNIHLRGIIHRGISPYTILVDSNQKLYIDGFALSGTRTGGSELQAELFNGYTAPEQYTSTGWQGTWTDVYALAAVFYRTVSGIVPAKSTRVSEKNPVAPLDELLPDVPKHISQGIAYAMEPSTQNRTQTVAALLADMTAEEGIERTAVFALARDFVPMETIKALPEGANGDTENISSLEEMDQFRADLRRQQNGESQQEDFEDDLIANKPRTGVFVAALLAVVLIIGGILAVVVNSRLRPIKEKPDAPISIIGDDPNADPNDDGLTDPEDGGVIAKEVEGEVPNFVGRARSVVEFHPNYRNLYEFSFSEEFSSTHDKGTIIKQDPKEGTQVSEKTKVTLTVSKGGETMVMPNVVGKEYEEARQEIATAAGKVDVPVGELNMERVERIRAGATENIVIDTSPAPGKEFDPNSERIQIIVGKDTPAPPSSVASDPVTSKEVPAPTVKPNPKDEEEEQRGNSGERIDPSTKLPTDG